MPKTTNLNELTQADAADVLLIADLSAGQSKKITAQNLMRSLTGVMLPNNIDLSVADSAARAALTPFEGMLIYREDLDQIQTYDGSSWFTIAGKYPIGCRAVRSSTVSVAHATEQTISWNSEDYDSGTMHDNSSNPDRITVPEAGDYIIAGYAAFAVSVAASAIRFYKNGVSLGFYYVPGSVTGTGDVGAMRPERLAANDYITMSVFQSNGSSAARNLTQSQSFLEVIKV